MKKLLVFIFLSTGFLPVFAQDSTSTASDASMITNRPGFTEASRAVFKSGFQIESGFQYKKSPDYKGSESYSEGLFIPNLGLLYGVSKNVEIRIFGNLDGTRYHSSVWTSDYSYSLTGLVVGAKINLTQAKGALPEMALLLTEGFPTNNIGIQTWSTSALLAWSYSLPANFGLSGNLGYTLEYQFEDNMSLTNPSYFNYTVNLGYSIKENLGTYVEFYGASNIGDGTGISTSMTGGLWYRFNPKLQVDLLGGYGFDAGSYLFNVGFSWLILNK